MLQKYEKYTTLYTKAKVTFLPQQTSEENKLSSALGYIKTDIFPRQSTNIFSKWATLNWDGTAIIKFYTKTHVNADELRKQTFK